ncbi:MAG UNVERIFIED_CONTAM: hypothetical protein LVQ98_00925 [Rickettsiaceae bacterium]
MKQETKPHSTRMTIKNTILNILDLLAKARQKKSRTHCFILDYVFSIV